MLKHIIPAIPHPPARPCGENAPTPRAALAMAAEIMQKAVMVDGTGKIPFVDTDTAARYLALSPHSLECYRSLGGAPPFDKFGKFVRYAVPDLEIWAPERRHTLTAGDNARVY